MLVHILPVAPPDPNGLSDYCQNLWNNWPAPRPKAHILALRVSDESGRCWPDVGASSFAPSVRGLLSALNDIGATDVIVHFTGHGYQRKGCPLWLPIALKSWKRKSDNRLVMMFHELYARGGNIRQSHFWLEPIARGIVRQLARDCDIWVTNCTDYQEELEQLAPARAHTGVLIPVGPNIVPEIEVNFFKPWPLANGRKLKVCIFGFPNTRRWALEQHAAVLKALCEQDLIENIVLLGRPDQGPSSPAEQLIARIGFPHLWKREYNLPTQDISRRLLQQDLGLVANSMGTITKSGVYAAFTAHGMLTIVSEKQKRSSLTMPCFLNDDMHPERCMQALQSADLVGKKQCELKDAASGLLSWQSISAKWKTLL